MNWSKSVSKKSLSDELFLHFSSKVQNLTVCKYLHDSNSIFRAAGINTETFFGRMVREEGGGMGVELRGCAVK